MSELSDPLEPSPANPTPPAAAGSIPFSGPPSPDGSAGDVDGLIDEIALWVESRRLETPALLFLEAHRPVSFLASQALLVGMPLLAPLFGLRRIERFSRLLESTTHLERLIDRIEAIGGPS